MGIDGILVTGASGLLGSNVARIAAERGRRVRGLVRKPEDAEVLRGLGVEPAIGDVTDPDSLRAAMAGMEAVAHCAALIGGTWSRHTAEEFEAVNYRGTANVMDAAVAAGLQRTILVSTRALQDASVTGTERSGIIGLFDCTSEYQRAKLASYYDAMHRAARGMNLSFVLPAAMYGPSPFVQRAVHPTLFTGSLLMAIRGELKQYANFALTWPWANDAAEVVIGAVDDDQIGYRYMAAGRDDDAMSLAQFCNLGCEFAGVSHRVEDLDAEQLGDSLGTMRAFAKRELVRPIVDATDTNRRLGTSQLPVVEGVERTVRWMRDQRLI